MQEQIKNKKYDGKSQDVYQCTYRRMTLLATVYELDDKSWWLTVRHVLGEIIKYIQVEVNIETM